MGYFSWDCKGCNHSVREGHGWMGKAVVQGKDGSVVKGEYDGYGRISGDLGGLDSLGDIDGSFELWHQTCFKLMGRPEYSGPSRSARDQGTPPSDEFPEPRHADDLRALIELADQQLRKDREQAQMRATQQTREHEIIGEARKCPHCRFDTYFVIERNGALMIRCPNRSCTKLRAFPQDKAEAWRELAALYPEGGVIWDDRDVGPHFETVRSVQHQIKQYEQELKDDPADAAYYERRLSELRATLIPVTADAEAAERGELNQ